MPTSSGKVVVKNTSIPATSISQAARRKQSFSSFMENVSSPENLVVRSLDSVFSPTQMRDFRVENNFGRRMKSREASLEDLFSKLKAHDEAENSDEVKLEEEETTMAIDDEEESRDEREDDEPTATYGGPFEPSLNFSLNFSPKMVFSGFQERSLDSYKETLDSHKQFLASFAAARRDQETDSDRSSAATSPTQSLSSEWLEPSSPVGSFAASDSSSDESRASKRQRLDSIGSAASTAFHRSKFHPRQPSVLSGDRPKAFIGNNTLPMYSAEAGSNADAATSQPFHPAHASDVGDHGITLPVRDYTGPRTVCVHLDSFRYTGEPRQAANWYIDNHVTGYTGEIRLCLHDLPDGREVFREVCFESNTPRGVEDSGQIYM